MSRNHKLTVANDSDLRADILNSVRQLNEIILTAAADVNSLLDALEEANLDPVLTNKVNQLTKKSLEVYNQLSVN